MREEKKAGSEKPKTPPVVEEVAPQPRPATGTYGMVAGSNNPATTSKAPLSFVI